MKKRLFIAIHLPDHLKEELTKLQKLKEVKKLLAQTQGRFTKAENLHITVSFLDTIEENLVDGLIEIINNICQKRQPFKITFQNIVLGPPGKLARMIWATFATHEDYNKLKSDLNQKIVDFLKDKKHPIYLDSRKEPIIHVTLARFRQYIQSFPISYGKIQTKEITCSSLSLMESKLSPKGAIYTELAMCTIGEHNL